MKFQILKRVNTLQPSTLHYINKKVNKIQKDSIKKVMEHVAPGQGNSLQKLLFPEKDVADNNIPSEIKNLYDAFNASSNKNERCAILSLIPYSYSKSDENF